MTAKKGRLAEEEMDPRSLLGISLTYAEAADTLIRAFGTPRASKPRMEMFIHPVSQLLGIAVETALKGLLACRSDKVPKSHDLADLFARVRTDELHGRLQTVLSRLDPPDGILALNPEASVSEIEGFYRRPHYHIEMINSVYDRPYASRYPTSQGVCVPDPVALGLIVGVLQMELRSLLSGWRPSGLDA